jgi:23S rRNA (guanosine2251-2'-O)-methyltransferase
VVVKASAGVAFFAPVLRAGSAAEAVELLAEHGYPVYGLASGDAESLFGARLTRPSAFVLVGETTGIGQAVRPWCTATLSIPMSAGVESLNVAAAAAVLCFELRRRD